MFFENRADAGKKLADIFLGLNRNFSGWNIVGIARGGVIIGLQIAKTLSLPLQAFCIDDFLIMKSTLVATSLNTGYLFQTNGSDKISEFIPDISGLSPAVHQLSEFLRKLADKQLFYNNGPFEPKDQIILCDDGVVSGRSLFATIDTLRHHDVKKIIVAIPVVPPWLKEENNGFELVTWRVTKLRNPTTGIFYFNFDDVPDEMVRESVLSCS